MRKHEALALTKRLKIGQRWTNGQGWVSHERTLKLDDWNTVIGTITFNTSISHSDVSRIMSAIKTTLEKAR